MSFSTFAVSLSLLLCVAYSQDTITISRTFLDKPVFTKLTIFANPKNSREVFLEAVETTVTSKTIYWVTKADVRTKDENYVFVAKSTSSVTPSSVLDSTVPSSQRGEAVPAADAALTSLFADTNTTNNAFATLFGDKGAPSTKFLFRLGTDGKNDIVCVVARGADLGASEADSPVLSCAPVVAGTLNLAVGGVSPTITPLVATSFFSKIQLTATDIDWASSLRFTSVQRGNCVGVGSDASVISAGVIMLVPVKCNSSWTSEDDVPVKCSSGFKHTTVALDATFLSDASFFFYNQAYTYGFNVARKFDGDESQAGTERPTVRVHRVENSTSNQLTNPNATCIFVESVVNSFIISEGIASDVRFSVDAEWQCPKDVCKQEDFDKFSAPSPIDFGSPSSSSAGNNSILDCTAAGFGVLSCLPIIQSDVCKSVGLGSFDFGASMATTSAPTTAPVSLEGYCKCADSVFECLVKAGCKRNPATAANAEQVMKCKAACPDYDFCAANSIAMNGAALLFALVTVIATMVQWN
jgi:hypothetical protein